MCWPADQLLLLLKEAMGGGAKEGGNWGGMF